MSDFRLVINLGNEAMQSAEDVADALERTARQLRILEDGDFNIYDSNGNSVGGWSMPATRYERHFAPLKPPEDVSEIVQEIDAMDLDAWWHGDDSD